MSRTAIFERAGRLLGWFVALATTTVLALNFERLAIAHRLDQLIPDPAHADGVIAFVQRPLLVVLSALALGTLLGLAISNLQARLKSGAAGSNKGHSLGVRMLSCAHTLSNLQTYSVLHTDQDRRNAVATLNIAMVDAHRLGLRTPAQNSPPDDVLNYLTEVGSWLMKGDVEIAKIRATALSGDDELAGG